MSIVRKQLVCMYSFFKSPLLLNCSFYLDKSNDAGTVFQSCILLSLKSQVALPCPEHEHKHAHYLHLDTVRPRH